MFQSFYILILLLFFSLQLYAQPGRRSTLPKGIGPNAAVYEGNTVSTSNQTVVWESGAFTSPRTVLASATITVNGFGGEETLASGFPASDTATLGAISSVMPVGGLSTSTPEPVFNTTTTPVITLETTKTIPPPAHVITETTSYLTTTTFPPSTSTATPAFPPGKPSSNPSTSLIAILSGGGGSLVLLLIGLAVYIWICRRKVKEPDFIPEPVRPPKSPPAMVMYMDKRGDLEGSGYVDIEKEEGEADAGPNLDALYFNGYSRSIGKV